MFLRRLAVAILFGLMAAAISFFKFSFKPKLETVGWNRKVDPVGNTKCKVYPEAQACEKITIHEPTGLVYMACSTIESRPHWMPTLNRFNVTGKSSSDYVAVFDPSTEKIKRLQIQGFKYSRGLSVHGMDVVNSKQHPSEHLIYLVNHRQPLPPADPKYVGSDSTIEVFNTSPGSDEMHFVATYKDPVIATPNDIVAGPEDMSFYFTNDHGLKKAGLARRLDLDLLLGLNWANVGYCDPSGCKIAAENLFTANGITKDQNGKVYVGSAGSGRIYVTERQTDNRLIVTDEIPLDRSVDNIAMDESGAIWAAGIVNALQFMHEFFPDPVNNKAASSALRITLNDGEGSFFGEKYKVEKLFEDDGTIASGATSAAYDYKRKKLYIHGVSAPHLAVCEL